MTGLRRRLSHLLFVLGLLLAQQALVAHPLTHGLGQSGGTDDPGGPSERIACVLCIAGTATGAALPSAPPALLTPATGAYECAPPARQHYPRVTLAFSSRAPPRAL
jgi:hypothetical protein